jgi:hypothetical protein
MKKIGYIDGRKLRVGGMPQWGPVPAVLTPGVMEAYGVFDDFIGVEDLAAAASLATSQAVWEYWIQVAATIAQADVAGGAGIITTGALDNDSGQIIMGSNAGGGGFFPAANLHMWFEARARMGLLVAAATFNYFVGLVNPVAAAILTDDGAVPAIPDIIGFIVRDGEANWSFMGDNAGAQDINPLGAGCVTDNAFHTFGFYVNGVTDVTCYYDRVAIAAGALATANIPVTGLMPAFAVKTGDALNVADTIEFDYVMCAQLR